MSETIIDADICIIGAGVVGCAIARELSLKMPAKNIIVAEKLGGAGFETSTKNSGVLHSGIHQNPEFLKSKLAEEGNKLAVQYVKEKGLRMLNCGMLVAVTFGEILRGLYKEISTLLNLLDNAREQKIPIKFLMPWQVKKIAPQIRAIGGIFIPEARVIDSKEFINSLKNDAEAGGVKFLFNSEVHDIKKQRGDYHVFTTGNIINTQVVINSAGLYADDVANMAGFNGYKVYPWRGEYYEIIGDKRDLVNLLIYPTVPKDSPSKGIHFGPRVDGRLFIGPNARPVENKDDYEVDKTPVEVYLKHARKYFPQLKREDLRWSYSGIRPKAKEGAEESDFIIKKDSTDPVFINLIGIDSPGLTASMAIAKYVYNLL
ncbi:MAG: NAD(P)/FAD-dependent oxidoreductase [Candidatus Spechtbacterales bacterium]|nr:NAD(P)/FAD-dependent oxidoreductase [Candidatus Spechtbacterales bacterium]